MLDLGTVLPGSTIRIPINTFDSNDPSQSVTATTWLNTDCHVHKDGGTTQRASSAGETLSIDFDTVSGNHLLAIDLADNTTANFYEAGSEYHVRIEGVTVDAGTINAWIARWRIGYPGALLDTTIATLAGQTSFTLEDGSADNDAYNGSLIVVHDLASAVQVAQGAVSDYVGSTKTITLGQDPGIFTMAVGDNVSVFPAHALPVWDRVLTGATHNIASSAGRRLRSLQDFGLYEGGAVWVDTVNGTAGTVDFENGTVTNPVDTIADAKTIADSVGLKRFQIIAGSTITLAATFDNYAFSADDGWTLALGGQSVDSASFDGATVSGTFTGSPHITNCTIGAITGPAARIGHSGLSSTITANAAGDWFLHDCFSEIAGASTPIFDFGTDVGINSNVTFANYQNGIEFRNFNNSGTDLLSIAGTGQIVYAATSSGTVNQRGAWRVTNTGGVTITADDITTNIDAILVDTADMQPKLGTPAADVSADIAAVKVDTAATLLDTAEIGTAGAGLTNINLPDQTMNITGNLSGSVGSVTGAVGSVTAEVTADVTKVSGSTAAADQLEAQILTAVPVTFTGGSTTTAVLGNVDGAGASSVDDFYNNRILVFNAGTLEHQVVEITDYVGSTTTATISAATTAVTGSHTAIML